MEVTELEHYLHVPEDADNRTESFAESVRDDGGCGMFVLLDTEGGGRGAHHLWTARERAELRRQEETDAKYPELIPEFDAVYVWMLVDRVIIERMTTYLAGERQNVFVELEEMEKHTPSPMDTEGIIGVSAQSTCGQEGRRRFVAVKSERTTLVAHAKQCPMMRAMQEKAYQERERETREAFGHDGTKAKNDERSLRGFSEKDIPGYQGRS